MDDKAVGITIAAVIAVSTIFKKKKAEAAAAEVVATQVEAPTSAVTQPSPVTGISAQAIEQLKAMQQEAQSSQAVQIVTPGDRAMQVVVPTMPTTTADYAVPLTGVVDRSVINTDAAMGGFFKSLERSIRKELSRAETSVRKELSRAETSVRKQLARTEQDVRHELKRVERKYLRNLDPVKVITTIVGYAFPPIGIAIMAYEAITAYEQFAQAKRVTKRAEGAQLFANEVSAEVTAITAAPERLAVTAEGGTLGYLAKRRINSSFVPLTAVYNSNLKDRFFVTTDMLPVLVAAGYEPIRIVGYISKVPFSGSSALKLMYSFELMEFVVATDGSKYMSELMSNGYNEVSKLGYVSRSPIEGPETSKLMSGVESV